MVANMQPKDDASVHSEPQDIGSYLRLLRNRLQLGLREAARDLAVDPGHLSKLERNVGMPPGGELMLRFAKYYRIPVDELLRRAKVRTLATVVADKDLWRRWRRLLKQRLIAMEALKGSGGNNDLRAARFPAGRTGLPLIDEFRFENHRGRARVIQDIVPFLR